MTATDEMVATLGHVAAVVGDMPVDDPGWDRHADAVDAAYHARDLDGLRVALADYEAFAAEQRAVYDRTCRWCGRGPSCHRRADVCARYEPRADVLAVAA